MSQPTPEKKTEETPGPKYVAKADGADPFATRLTRELKHDRGILACRYEPSSRFVFAGALDNFVHRWDLSDESETGKREPLEGHESWVRAMCLFPDGKQLATGDYVGRLIAWSDIGGKPSANFSIAAHEGSIRAVSVSPDGKLIATAGNDDMVRVWSADKGEKVLELAGHECHVYNIAFHPNGKALLSADLKGVLKHWEIPTGKHVRDLNASLLYTYSVKYTVDVGGIRGMSFNADGSQLACTGATGVKGIAHSGSARVLLFDWKSGKLTQELKPVKDEIATAWSVRFHPDGFIVASGGSRTGGFLWFWVPEDPDAFHMVKFKQRAPGFDLDLAPDGKTLAVANHDGAVRLYVMEAAPEEPAAKKK